MGAIIRLEAPHARAYAAEPEHAPRARILVVHDAYGLLAHVRQLCDELASHGFVAIAPDLFSGAATRSPGEASRLLEQLTAERAAQVLDAAQRAFDTLGYRAGADAVVGFSTGADFALGLVSGGQVRAIVAYYALPDDDVERDTPLLLHLAGSERCDDERTPDDVVAALRTRWPALVAHLYPGAGHGFANVELDTHDPAAAQQAWQRTISFLTDHLAAA